MTRGEIENGLRVRLDDWRFWMGIAYFGLALTLVAIVLIVVRNEHTAAAVAAQAAVHQSEIQSNAISQYQQCLHSIPLTKKINLFAESVLVVQSTILSSSEAILKNTPKSSKLYKVRLHNVEQLQLATTLPEEIHFNVPTLKSCQSLEQRLLLER